MATAFKKAFDEAEPAIGWAEPDMSITREGVSPPKFPETLLGDLAPIVRGLAVSGGTSFDFVAMSLLSMSASILGSKRMVRPYAESHWREPAVLWVGLVCPASSGKSPAINPLSDILARVQGDYRLNHEQVILDWKAETERARAEHKLWQEAVSKAVKDGEGAPNLPPSAVEPKEPVARRFYVNDTTPEALARILVGNPQGVAVIADELASWFASFERYSGDARGFWLTAYNGKPYTIDRKGNPEPIFIPFLGVSVLGGIQPGRLAEAFRGTNDGLHSRLMWVWPESVPYARPTRAPDLDRIEAMFRALDSLSWGIDERGDRAPVVLPLDAYADAVFEAFDRTNKEERREAPDTLLMAAVGKMPGQVVRLALTVEFLKWALRAGPEPSKISGETMEAACAFMSDYVRPMAERVYGDAALPDVDRRTVTLARWIKRHQPVRFNANSDILKQRAAFGFRCKDELKESLDQLVDAGWVRPCGTRVGPTKGRHSSDYAVNPIVRGE